MKEQYYEKWVVIGELMLAVLEIVVKKFAVSWKMVVMVMVVVEEEEGEEVDEILVVLVIVKVEEKGVEQNLVYR